MFLNDIDHGPLSAMTKKDKFKSLASNENAASTQHIKWSTVKSKIGFSFTLIIN